ncbi:MAG: SUMF1/EgtB/PvdO family nonheme iron enzyme [Deltaproteobacteria bacterium]|jgi:formylglycine-generating enzyme|nr:SUMF1/EgtB/PvdO family nonheme iron enzyme [Deltaproteobacteria bacterium]
MANQLPLEDCSEFGCPNGCVQIDYGVDDNANGALDNPSEIDGTEYVCHGTNGEDGTGSDGQDGAQGDAGSDGEDGTNGADGAGCTVSQADCQATLSCEDGTSVSWGLAGCACDNCGVCDFDTTNDCVQDCAETWGGTAVEDICGTCDFDTANDCVIPEGMVEVSGGDYLYGDPTTLVFLPAFYIDQYEVTAGDYKSCVDAGVCQYNGSTTNTYRTYDNGKDTHPINYVDWNEATAYCAWKGKHLPTEQEWEKAARGTAGRTYPWGEDAPDGTRSNYYESGDAYEDALGKGTTPAGYFDGVNMLAGGNISTVNSPSPYGAYDTAGNVWEWTNSWYDESYCAAAPESSPPDPANEDEALVYRVLQGGSWGLVNTDYLRASSRISSSPADRYDGIGFRCSQ